MCIYIYIHTYVYIFIYIKLKSGAGFREPSSGLLLRGSQRLLDTCIHMYAHIYIYIYIYTHKHTLNTYNTWIQLSRLQKIYHFQSLKLRLATKPLTVRAGRMQQGRAGLMPSSLGKNASRRKPSALTGEI